MIIVTGASDGLGLQLAKLYGQTGKRVINISRRKSEFSSENMLTDITNENELRESIKEILMISEPIEALINCAGVMSAEELNSLTSEEIDRTLGVNVKGPMLLVSGLVDRLRADRSDVINVASTIGLKAYAGQATYGVSKWAMRGFSQNLQVELKDTNRVISFCVGGFISEIGQKATGRPITDPANWMDPFEIAVFMKQIIDLPKNMEVSEIVINRKSLQ